VGMQELSAGYGALGTRFLGPRTWTDGMSDVWWWVALPSSGGGLSALSAT
jgi:hypothetical protein